MESIIKLEDMSEKVYETLKADYVTARANGRDMQHMFNIFLKALMSESRNYDSGIILDSIVVEVFNDCSCGERLWQKIGDNILECDDCMEESEEALKQAEEDQKAYESNLSDQWPE